MVLSDVTIAKLIAEGRIGIDPYDGALLQPSSVDVRVDRYFRVFHNARYAFIDVKQPQEELTEEVAIDDERPFILHPKRWLIPWFGLRQFFKIVIRIFFLPFLPVKVCALAN